MYGSAISKKLIFGLSICFNLMGSPLNMHNLNTEAKKLFGYDPEYELINKQAHYDHVMITCHGSGANKGIANIVAQEVNLPIITFNFPDHDMDEYFDLHASSLGTINDYLPLIYLLAETVKSGIKKISLYGFSAGGGAIITSLAILNNQAYRAALLNIGISREDIPEIFAALSNGIILLDAPLKSVTEILSIRPDEEFVQVLSKRFKKNGFDPIDSIDRLKGLTAHILLYFEKPDEILANRDDDLFYHKLKAVNNGKTELITGHDGGHNGFHQKLWTTYKKLF